MRKVSIKQAIADNCATISLMLPILKKIQTNQPFLQDSLELIETAVKEMRQVVEEVNVDAGYLVINTQTQCRTITSILTQSMIDQAIKIDKDIDIIRMSDGKILDIDCCELGYKWVSLGIY